MLYLMPLSVFDIDPIVVAHGFSCSVACGTFLGQGSVLGILQARILEWVAILVLIPVERP